MKISTVTCPYCGRLHRLPPSFQVVYGHPGSTIQCNNAFCRENFRVDTKFELCLHAAKIDDGVRHFDLPYIDREGNIEKMPTRNYHSAVTERFIAAANKLADKKAVKGQDVHILPAYSRANMVAKVGVSIQFHEVELEDPQPEEPALA